MNKKFYEKTWFMWVCLIFFAPIGIFLLWKYGRYNKNTRIILTAVSCIIFIVAMINVNKTPQESKVTNTQETKQVEQPKEEQKQEVKKESNKELGQLFKLSEIKNKSQDEVSKILGAPTGNRQEKWHYYDTKEEANNCFVNIYQKNNSEIEIFFIEGKAARVTITPKDTIASSDIKNILNMFYLDFTNPTFSNGLGMRWNNQFGVYEFAINFENEKVSFIHIILDEKYK